MGGRASREKGKRGERKLATELREAFPEFAEEVRRGWQSRQGDDEPDVLGIPGVWLEHKHGAKPNPRAALAQAIGDSAGKALTPVAVIRDNRKPPFVVLMLTDFIKIYRRSIGLEGVNESGRSNQGSGRSVLRTERGWRLRPSRRDAG